MNCKPSIALRAIACSFLLISTAAVQAQDSNWQVPRTASGRPVLQGYWTSSTVVPVERPVELGDKAFYTEAEYQTRLERSLVNTETEIGTQADVHYQLDDYGLSRGQNEIVEDLATSIITHPANGRLPPVLEEVNARAAAIQAYRNEHGFDSAQDRPLAERCIIWPHEGPPLMPVGYNSNSQIMQTDDHVGKQLVRRISDAGHSRPDVRVCLS